MSRPSGTSAGRRLVATTTLAMWLLIPAAESSPVQRDGGMDRVPTQLEQSPSGFVAIPVDGYRWQHTASSALPNVPLFGDAASGPFLRVLSMEAGVCSPPHWHSEDKHCFVLQGVVSQDPIEFSREASIKLGPGGYFGVRAGKLHATCCSRQQNCILAYFMAGPLVTRESNADGGAPPGR